jgi:uncharacterized membrane protein HdeD (DUF308 family)
MSFAIYSIGYLVLIVGIAYIGHLMHLPDRWIGAIVIVLAGIGIVTGVQSTRHKDPS